MVRDLYFKAGRVVRQAPEPKPEKEKRRPLSDQELSWVSEQAASVEDPDLRAVFENLIKRDLQNR
jgi:hypothetical protein